MKVTNSDFKAIAFELERHAYTYRIFRCGGLWSATAVSAGCTKFLLIMKPKAACIAAINEHIKLYGESEK